MTEPTAYLVSIGPGYCAAHLTVRGLRVLQKVGRAVYPGAWLGGDIIALLGNRLVHGHHLDGTAVMNLVRATLAEGDDVAVLFNGDGSIYSGWPPRVPSQGQLDTSLKAIGASFAVIPGLSSFQILAAEAGLQLAPFTVLSAAQQGGAGDMRSRLAQVAGAAQPLVVYCATQQLPGIADVLSTTHGPETSVVLGSWLGWPQQQIRRTTVAGFVSTAGELDEPLLAAIGFRDA